MRWMHHLQQSPYCNAHYPILVDNQGRDICMCGWVGPKTHKTHTEVMQSVGKTLGEIMHTRKEK